MSTTYLTDNKEIVFLNNHNIAQERDDDIQYNAIPSLSLVNKLYDDVALSASNVSTELESLSAVDKYLSSEISSTVTFVYKTGTGTATTNKLSVIEVTNDEYNNLASRSMLDPKAMYVIDDDFIDAKGRTLSNLADPTADVHAANKKYVDSVSVDTLDAAKTYANSLSASLSTTVPAEIETAIETLSTSLSGTVDSKRNKAIEDLSTSLSTTIVDSNYAVINSNLKFKYRSNTKELIIEVPNINNEITVLSVDALEFVKNRIVDSLEIVDNKLRIYWSAEGSSPEHEYVEIDINKLTTVYQGSPDGAIKIIRATDSDDVDGNEPYVISADYSIIAKTENLNSLAGMVNALSNTTIPGIASTVNTLSTDRIPTIEGNVSALSTELTAVADSTKFAGKFAGLSSTVKTLSNSVTENTDNIAKLEDYAKALSADDTGIIARLTDKADNAILSATNAKSVTDGLLAAGGQINTLSTDLITANGRIDGLNSKVEGLSSLANSHTAALHSHDFNIEQNATNISELSGSARAWDTTLSNNLVEYTNGRVTSLSTTVNTISNLLSTDVETLSVNLSTDVKALSVNLSTDVYQLSVNLSTDVYQLSSNLSTDITTLSVNLSTDLSATKKSIAESLATLAEGMTVDQVIGILLTLKSNMMEA